jgi:sialate O-acetylesterase
MIDRLLSGLMALSILGSSATVMADVKLPALFTPHMVLQREMPVPVWGTADPGEAVTVEFGDQRKTATADAEGNWKVVLDSLQTGAPRSLVVRGKNVIEVGDVLVGEVWVCSGQSNMEWPVAASMGSDLELASSQRDTIRLITVHGPGVQTPLRDFDGAWEVANPSTLPNFSAVGYYFARRLQSVLNVPIGLIDNSWGGSACEAWIPQEKLTDNELYAPILQHWKNVESQADEAALRAEYAKVYDTWKQQMAEAVAQSKPIPSEQRPNHPLLGQNRPANMYNSRVAPLVPFAIRGAIWYQGESNAGRAYQYREMFPLMISTWREAWGQGDFPFYWVQLADFMAEQPEPKESAWAELREAQTLTLDKLENVGQAVIIDVGDGKDIHPINKQTVGDRLARWALAKQYQVAVGYASPRFESLEVQGDKAIVTLSHCESGLMNLDVPEVLGFTLAGEDRKWYPASAKIVGKNKVEVTSPDVPAPIAVRYAWADNPRVNLYTRQGLPVTPFRSDDWPGVTAENR